MVCSLGNLYTKVQEYAEYNYRSKFQEIQNSYWYGKGANIVGLNGQVTPYDYNNSHKGIDTQGNVLRQQQSGRNSNPGRDITFSAPKSVSLLGLVKKDADVIQAHQQAVNKALNYVEQNSIFTRIGKGGAKHQKTDNALVAVFQHNDNRNQEPHLHSHCVVFNQTQGQDGKWRSMDNRELYHQKMTFGAVYYHELGKKVKSLGYELNWNKDGTFNILGYSQDKIQLFSSRRQEIINAVGKDASAIEKSRACTFTRVGKIYKSPQEKVLLRNEWERTAKIQGIIHPQQKFQDTRKIEQPPSLSNDDELIKKAIANIANQNNQLAFLKHELLKEMLIESKGEHELGQLEKKINHSKSLIQTKDGQFTTSNLIEKQKEYKKDSTERNFEYDNYSLGNKVASILDSKIKVDSHQFRIEEISNSNSRQKYSVQDYSNRDDKKRSQTLIIVDTVKMEKEITSQVRQELIKQHKLGDKSWEINVLEPKELNQYSLSQTNSYSIGDIIKFNRSSKKFNRQLYYRVDAINSQNGTLKIRNNHNQVQDLKVNRYKDREVFRTKALELRTGEQMQFTRTHYHNQQKRINRQRFSIAAIENNDKIAIYTNGKSEIINPSQLLYSNYQYAATTEKELGRSVKYGIYLINADNTNTENFQVNTKKGIKQVASKITRELTVYTEDIKSLYLSVQEPYVPREPQTRNRQVSNPNLKSMTKEEQNSNIRENYLPQAAQKQNQQSTKISRNEEFRLIVASKYLVEQLGKISPLNSTEKLYKAKDGTEITRGPKGLTITQQGKELKFDIKNTNIRNTFSPSQINQQVKARTNEMRQQQNLSLTKSKTQNRSISR